MKNQTKRSFFFTRWIDYSSDAGGVIGAICLAALALIITYEVMVRYFIGSPTTWVQELSVYLCMAIGFLAAAFALRNDSHFAVTIFVDRLRAVNRRRLRTVTHLVGLAYSVSFVVKGIEMVQFSYDMEDVSTGLLQVPLWIPNALVPIGGALLALQFFNKLVNEITGSTSESSGG